MNGQMVVAAVVLIGVGLFGLIMLAMYAQIQINRGVPKKRKEPSIVAVHRFKSQKRHRAMRPALAAPAMPIIPTHDEGDSRWQRPGFAAPARAANERAPLPYYEPHKPRHVFIPRQTSMPIIAHETVGPEQARPQPRLSQRTQRSQATVLIKTIRVDDDPEPYKPSVRPAGDAQWPVQASYKQGKMDKAI
jgi:hypothetical protein